MNYFWTKEEIQYLKKHYKIKKIKEIAATLGRSEHAVYQKIRRLKLNKKLLSSGVSYKKILPPEKWFVIEHFIACFCRLAIEAEETGRAMDVNSFFKEYIKAYVKGGKEVAML